MREIAVSEITRVVADLCKKANILLGEDVEGALAKAHAEETGLARSVIKILLDNADVAKQELMPLCQDTGMAVVFLEIGQDVHFCGGDLTDAINQGVRQGYREGFFRASVVDDPIMRKNTGDNTPAIIHSEIVAGDKLKVIVAPKGFGSENMSAVRMLKPSEGEKGVIEFVLEVVRQAGANPCPPLVIGVGLGGTMEKAALLAKKALLRPLNSHNPLPHLAGMESELLKRINMLGIGPQGLGGKTTALSVAVEAYATHIAGLPVAVNINCHVARHAEAIL